jgi:hypothetical protein
MCASGQLKIGYAGLATAMPTGKTFQLKPVFPLFYGLIMNSDFFRPRPTPPQIAAFYPRKEIFASNADVHFKPHHA